ncbi:MAG: ABC transporter permease [Micrococcales bacterium]
MIAYIMRRLGTMLIVLFGSTFIVFNLGANMGDPLEALRISQDPKAHQMILVMTRELHLDVPSPIRYFYWLRGVLAGFVGQLDLGRTRDGLDVIAQLGDAIPTSIRLVALATLLAIVLGISIGIVTALRQYSRFDYAVTFYAFLCFSLPVFWFAVLLKQFLAIGFNNFLANPEVTTPWVVGLALISGVFWAAVIGGSRARVWTIFGIAAGSTAGIIVLMGAVNWFTNPGLGIALVGLFSIGAAVAITQLSTGLSNRRTLYSALSVAGFGIVLYYPLQWVANQKHHFQNGLIVTAVFVLFAIAISFVFNKIDRGPAVRTSVITAAIVLLLLFVDKLMQTWPGYMATDAVNYRPVPTVGQVNDLLEPGNFWNSTLDTLMHLVLPTIALAIISFAGYVRYARGSLLEVLNQDYIRTARAKGLTERTVIMRHAFRNTLIPLTTIMVSDIVGIIGGAVITESIFGWIGMGSLFRGALNSLDLNMLMGISLVTASLAMIANLLADLLYSALDPRIRAGK